MSNQQIVTNFSLLGDEKTPPDPQVRRDAEAQVLKSFDERTSILREAKMCLAKQMGNGRGWAEKDT